MQTPIQRARRRWGALKNERSSWFDHWREINDFLCPRKGRFLITDRNRGEKKHNDIYDPTATRSWRTLAAGLMAGMTSPARPWFRLATFDSDLMEYGPVKGWLHAVTRGMRDVFTHSNTYRALHSQYEELGAFGTAADIILDDFDNVMHNYPLSIGEYAVATNEKGVVTTLYREFELTVDQIVTEFGLENCSQTVKNLYNDGKGLDQWIPVIHVIEPRKEYDRAKRDARNMPIKSCYFESGHNEDKYLRESGFKRFPGIVSRWDVKGSDAYGDSPGMEALGFIKQLQHEALRKAEGIDYKTKPPLQVPSTLHGKEKDFTPGGVVYVDTTGPNSGVRTAFEVDLELNHLLADIQDTRQQVSKFFYEDLFLMLANDTRSNITAREIVERHEEKLLMLGPVLERLHNEMLSPLIDIAFEKMLAAGMVPPPPEELQNQELNIEFVSMLAQAQRAVGLGSVDRLLGTVGAIAQFKPDVLDKLDSDEIVDAYADMLGVDPNLIVADDKVAVIRSERAQQQAALQAAATIPAAAQTAKTLSETDTENKNALTDAVGMFSGYVG